MIEINGKHYEPIQRAEVKSRNHRGGSAFMAMAMAFAPHVFNDAVNKMQRESVSIDFLIKEFGLIELKQSKLSKTKRDYIVKLFHENFKQSI